MRQHETGNSTDQAIRKIVVLPLRIALEISVKSLRVRFFRNMLTVMTLVLAVAFFTFVLVSSDLARGLWNSGDPALAQTLEKAGFDLPAPGESLASTAKERWLVALSLLVCMVGIINAQLMAVTERFREIGTMKCLGALDSFVLRLFLIEAGLQGLAGSLAGSLLGLLIAMALAMLRFGLAAAAQASPAALGLDVLAGIGVGLALSLIGVFYPALVAARMQPVEAMRAE